MTPVQGDGHPVYKVSGNVSIQPDTGKCRTQLVAKVEFHAGELSPRAGFIVTNLETDSRAVARFYNKRGTAEQ